MMAVLILTGCAAQPMAGPSTVAAARAIQAAGVSAVKAQASGQRAGEAIRTASEAVVVLNKTATPEQRPAVARVQQSLQLAGHQVTEMQTQLVAVSNALTESDARLVSVQQEGDRLAADLNSAQAKVAAYHRLKFWLALAAAGLAFMAALQFIPPLTPYRWGIAAGIGGVVFPAVFAFL